MEKVRIYELAKELNTTSKRLMEKLAEINIEVKNHMSLLEDHELKALYRHIGIISHDEKKSDQEEKKPAPPVVQPKTEVKKDIKSAPRIIRTTEIVVDSGSDKEQPASGRFDARRNDQRGGGTGHQRNFGSNNNRKRDMIRVAEDSSGLRAGFVRDMGFDYTRDLRGQNRADSRSDGRNDGRNTAAPKPPVKAEPRPEAKQDARAEQKQEARHEAKPETGAEVFKDPGREAAQEAGAAAKQDIRAKAKPEARGEAKGEAKPDGRQEDRRAAKEEARPAAAAGAKPAEKPETQQEAAKPAEAKPQEARQQESQLQSREAGAEARVEPRSEPRGEQRPQGDRRDNRNFNRPQYSNRPAGADRTGSAQDKPRGNYDRGPRNYENRDGRSPQQGGGAYGADGGLRQDRQYTPGQGGYQDKRPYDRNQSQGPREQGQGQGRPQERGQYGQKPPYRPNNAQGTDNRQGYGGSRNQGGSRGGQRPLEIPKPEISDALKEELKSARSEVRREFQNKDQDKDIKREQKKDISKTAPAAAKNKRFKPQTVVMTEKKGISEVLSEDFILNEFYDDSDIKKNKKLLKPKKQLKNERENKFIPHRAVLTSITIPETLTVKELAEALKKTSTDVIKKLMLMGIMANLNQEIDFDTASIIADEYGVKAEKAVVVNEEDILFDDEAEDESNLVPRPPVVVVMGHVDHGKTSLLDAIRKANVTDTEAGGITQHIGAYTVKINDRNITFLDTPGHEAFTAMRARGAQVTDIAILVVAADDGVMPQTIEAINHAKAANVSIIVAINKIDKPGANPDKVKQELTEYGLVIEEWGGDVIAVPVSAKEHTNIDHLLEMVLLTADILELKANPNRQAKGTVIEAKLDKNRGPLATVLVQRGTLNVGDSIVTGTVVGRIRAMTDDKGNSIKEAGPSTPVEILGLPDVPEAGEIFYAITDEKVAKQLAEKRKTKQREEQLKTTSRVTLEDLFSQIKEGKVKDLNIIVKADVQGSVEAVKQSLEKLSNDEVRVNTIHGGVGAITESDITLAQVSNAIIIGFNVRPGANVSEMAEAAGVDIRLYRIIYNAIEDIEAAMKGMLEPTFKEVVTGHTEIRQIFKVSGIGTIGGGYVTDGKITRNSDIRVVRDGIVIHEGKLASLKRFKDDAKEVLQGFECGLSIEKFNDIKEGDVIETYMMEEVKR